MYKTVIGLEVHMQLKTKTKNFSSSANDTLSSPNSCVSPIDMGYPGILPTVNKEGVKNALKIALALNCKIPKYLSFDRKNYFYPDLPKGYQITQLFNPIGTNGYVMININGNDKKVLIRDTHLEEDTASLDHYDSYSLLDYNRCGIPLLETVTEPCLNSAEEAVAFLETFKNIALYTASSTARADLGQIRCDVNVNLQNEKGEYITPKVEMKNISSFVNVKLAINSEVERQTKALETGEKLIMETRRFDEEKMTTFPLRKKVEAVDYRYYHESNIPRIIINDEFIENARKEVPVLAFDRCNKYINEYNISRKDASALVRDINIANYFEASLTSELDPITISNYLLNVLLGNINKLCLDINKITITPKEFQKLIILEKEGKISTKQVKEVISISLEQEKIPSEVIKENNIMQITDEKEIEKIIDEVINENNNLVEDFKNGKKVFDYFIGLIMKKTKGKVNPKITSKILSEKLERFKR